MAHDHCMESNPNSFLPQLILACQADLLMQSSSQYDKVCGYDGTCSRLDAFPSLGFVYSADGTGYGCLSPLSD